MPFSTENKEEEPMARSERVLLGCVIGILSGCLIFLMWAVPQVEAATPISNQVINTEVRFGDSDFSNVQYAGQSFTVSGGTLESITVPMKRVNTSTTGTISIQLCKQESTPSGCTPLATRTRPASDFSAATYQWLGFDFSSANISFEPGATYWVLASKDSMHSTNTMGWWGTGSSDEITSGDGWVYASGAWGSAAGFTDFGLIIETADDVISFEFPENASTIPDFSEWVVVATTTEDSTWTMEVDYGQSSGSYEYTDTIEPVSGFLISSQANIPKSVLLGSSSWPNVWYARAELYNGETLAAQSAEISFEVDYRAAEGGSSYFPTPTSTATSSEWSITCDETSGFWGNSLCNMFSYLFSPSPTIMNKWVDLKTSLQNKPPWGYVEAYSEAMDALEEGEGAEYTLEVQDSIESIVGPFQDKIEVVIWLAFGIFALNFVYHL